MADVVWVALVMFVVCMLGIILWRQGRRAEPRSPVEISPTPWNFWRKR